VTSLWWCIQEVRDYAVMEPASDELLFSEIYHSLIHSQSLDTLLSIEDEYAADMHRVLDDRDRNIAGIDARSVPCRDSFFLFSSYLTKCRHTF